MTKIDLHIHSSYSDDGEFTPQEIVSQCNERGMELIAITDHNSVKGVAEAMRAADSLKVIAGVELDCSYKGRNFHLLGYSFDFTKKEFAEIEQNILRQEEAAAEEKIRLFIKASGIPLNPSDIIAASKNGIVTGELIGEFVLALDNAYEFDILAPYLPGGIKSDMPYVRFYWDFFSEGKPAYVPIRYPELPDAAALIHNAGGIAVLAHPGQNLNEEDSLLSDIIAEGIDGIEVFSSYHNRPAAEYYLNIARQNHLLVTCGSDFHGKNKPKIQLGAHGLWLEDAVISSPILNFS